MSLAFTLGANTITVFLDGEIHTVDKSHVNYTPLLTELKKDPSDRNIDEVRGYVSIRRAIEKMSFGNVVLDGDAVFFKEDKVSGYLASRMIEIVQQGVGIEPWAYFMENLMGNPSAATRNELYEWLEKAKLPLTPDGCFIAFKKVKADYTDCHTGKFDNSVGNTLEMDRALCDPNRHNHCSTGFHFASVGYLRNFGGQKVMAVKINPRDVTAIPSDYQTTKGRCCRYEVVAELQDQNAASHGAWSKKPVVDLEDPQEFPDLLVKQLVAPEKKTTKSDGEKPISTKKTEDKVAPRKTKKAAKKVEKAGKSDQKFTTTTGKEFTAKQVLDALKKAKSGRAAATLLGIGESTLRGWKKALGL